MASVIEKTIRKVVTAGVTGLADHNRRRLPADSAFIRGIHAPIREEKTLENLRVTGEIPAALEGRYVRIGPNPFVPSGQGHH